VIHVRNGRVRVMDTSRIHSRVDSPIGRSTFTEKWSPKGPGCCQISCNQCRASIAFAQFSGEHGRDRRPLALPGGSLFQ